jgi:acetyl esterase/lipase
LAALAGARLVSVDYRLAPEDPFPCGLDDAVTAYRSLDDGLDAAVPVVLAGDSAGGGLAASLLGEIERLGLRPPASIGLLSPWLDLRNTAASFESNAASDPVFPLASAAEAADMYLGGQDASDPRVSPLLADWSGRPPLFVAASETECLRDDTRALAGVARAAGVHVELAIFADVPHGWWLQYPATPASREVVTGLAEFLCRTLDAAA